MAVAETPNCLHHIINNSTISSSISNFRPSFLNGIVSSSKWYLIQSNTFKYHVYMLVRTGITFLADPVLHHGMWLNIIVHWASVFESGKNNVDFWPSPIPIIKPNFEGVLCLQLSSVFAIRVFTDIFELPHVAKC